MSRHKATTPHWGDKPYYSLDYYFKQNFGHKIYKLALDAGMTCPNRDGTIDTSGCIFCSEGGSGDFATSVHGSDITAQINQTMQMKAQKTDFQPGYFAYLQSFSNTYAPVEQLSVLYKQILAHPQIEGLSIGTRPDCFSSAIYSLLEQCSKNKPIWIELGLQTIHETTADWMRRGYALPVFETTVQRLKALHIPIIVHIILGLPGESLSDILKTIAYLNQLGIDGIKLQLLHILKGTDLEKQYQNMHIYTLEEYIQVILACIGHLSPDIVIHRLTGDGPRDLLLAPTWSIHKKKVLNLLHHEMRIQGIYQGKYL